MGTFVREFTKSGAQTGAMRFEAFAFYFLEPVQSSYQIGARTSVSPVFQRRMFVKYNTSAIPDAAVITQVQLRWFVQNNSGSPSTWALRPRLGTWIGPTLDATAADYAGGTTVATFTYPSPPFGIYTHDLGPGALSLVNKTGDTDLSLEDVSVFTFGVDDVFELIRWSDTDPVLIVTYEAESAASVRQGVWFP